MAELDTMKLYKLEAMLRIGTYKKLESIAKRNGKSLLQLLSDLLQRDTEQYERANGRITITD